MTGTGVTTDQVNEARATILVHAYTTDPRGCYVWFDWLEEHGQDELAVKYRAELDHYLRPDVMEAMCFDDETRVCEHFLYMHLLLWSNDLARQLYKQGLAQLERWNNNGHVLTFAYYLDVDVNEERWLGQVLEVMGWHVNWYHSR